MQNLSIVPHGKLIPLTQSCTWNRCKFCYRSKEYPFQIATPEQFEEDIAAQRHLYAPDAPVFFVGANNFALSSRRLLEYLQILDRTMPEHGRVSMSSRADAIAKR